jgi:hypothetical protein
MISRTEWEDAAREVMEKERRGLGAAPTDDEVLAFSRGELSGAREELVRTYLFHYPELLDALTAPFPGEDAAPLLSDAERTQDQERLRFRLPKDRPRPLWTYVGTAASLAALALAGLLVRSQSTVRRLDEQLRQPRVDIEHRLLMPDGQRGGGPEGERPVPLPLAAENLLLIPTLINQPTFRDYRVELMDLNEEPARLIYAANGVPRRTDDTLEIWVPRRFFRPGIYQLVVFGVDGSRAEHLAAYTMRLPRT